MLLDPDEVSYCITSAKNIFLPIYRGKSVAGLIEAERAGMVFSHLVMKAEVVDKAHYSLLEAAIYLVNMALKNDSEGAVGYGRS